MPHSFRVHNDQYTPNPIAWLRVSAAPDSGTAVADVVVKMGAFTLNLPAGQCTICILPLDAEEMVVGPVFSLVVPGGPSEFTPES